MRHVREILRLRTAGISGNEIARRLKLAPSTVRLTLQRLTTAGLDWPLPAELTDAALEARLFCAAGPVRGSARGGKRPSRWGAEINDFGRAVIGR